MVLHPVRPATWGISLRQQRKVFFDPLLYRKHPRFYRERIRSGPRWDYYAQTGASLAALGLWAAGSLAGTLGAGLVAGALAGRFFASRLRGTSRAPAHVAEMAVTQPASSSDVPLYNCAQP